ncbi:hypothetical protein PSHT_01415, partial [Puccinia striiformis]
RTESIGITQHPGEVYGVAEGHRGSWDHNSNQNKRKTEDKQVEKNKRQKLHDQKQADKVRKEEEKKKKEEEKKKKKTEEPPKKRVNPARSTKTTTQKEKSQDAQTPPKKKLRPIKTAALLTPLTSTS